MSLPPVALAVIALDACGWALLAPATWTSLHVVSSWEPTAATAGQLDLERRHEASSFLGRGAVGAFGLSSLVLLVGLLVSLPRVVPGAMCAAGVLEALPGGRSMVGLRIVTLLAAVVWARLDRLNRKAPLAPLARTSARALLVLAALAAVASWRTATALVGLDLERTVSCCTILYDLAAEGSSMPLPAWLGGRTAAMGAAVSATLAVVVAPRAARGAGGGSLSVLAAGTLLWALLESVALVDWTAPYVFGAVGHRCPFCLFLPTHGGYGFWVWGAIALGCREAAVIVTTAAATRATPELGRWASRAQRRSLLSFGLLALIALGLMVWPVLRWRWETQADVFG